MPQVQFTKRLVEDTLRLRTSLGSSIQVQQRTVEMPQIQVPAIRQCGEHSSCATDSTETDADYQEDLED